MGNKNVKECSVLYVTQETQISTRVKYHRSPVRIAKIPHTDNMKYWQGGGATGTLICCLWEHKMVRLLWETAWQCRPKLIIVLPHDPRSTFLGIDSAELKTTSPRSVDTNVHHCKNRKQPRCLLIGDQINKLQYIHSMDQYSLIKNKL